MSEFAIDEKTRAALGRLTAGEKECLKRRLRHQTAKEMALDLGISPHAVEKRLKMARAKLGLSSSLEAARLMVASEGYQQTAPQTPDLETPPPVADNRFIRSLVLGVLTMGMLAALALTFAMQGQGEAANAVDTSIYEEAAENPGERRSITELEFVKASPERVRGYVRQMFDSWDVDGSGFVELDEAPDYLATGKPVRQSESPAAYDPADLAEELMGDAARRQYIANVDKDGDGKVSFEEFAKPVMPQFLERGIPLIPADWTPAPPPRD